MRKIISIIVLALGLSFIGAVSASGADAPLMCGGNASTGTAAHPCTVEELTAKFNNESADLQRAFATIAEQQTAVAAQHRQIVRQHARIIRLRHRLAVASS